MVTPFARSYVSERGTSRKSDTSGSLQETACSRHDVYPLRVQGDDIDFDRNSLGAGMERDSRDKAPFSATTHRFVWWQKASEESARPLHTSHFIVGQQGPDDDIQPCEFPCFSTTVGSNGDVVPRSFNQHDGERVGRAETLQMGTKSSRVKPWRRWVQRSKGDVTAGAGSPIADCRFV